MISNNVTYDHENVSMDDVCFILNLGNQTFQIKLCCFSPRKKWCLKKSTGTFFSQRDFQKSTGKVGGHIKHLSNFLYNSFMKLVFWLSNYQNMVKRGKKERKRSKPKALKKEKVTPVNLRESKWNEYYETDSI